MTGICPLYKKPLLLLLLFYLTERENGDDVDSLDEDDQPSSNRKASSKSVRFNTSIMSISDKGNKEKEADPTKLML